MGFSVTPLLSGGYLVEGQDVKGTVDTTVLKSRAWDAVLRAKVQSEAQEAFDVAVEAFFAPLTEAADAAKKAASPDDEWAVVTIGDVVEGKSPTTIHLDDAGVVLRILAETDGSSLRWVGGSLVAIR